MSNLAKAVTENLKCFLNRELLYWVVRELSHPQVDLEASNPNMKRRVSFKLNC